MDYKEEIIALIAEKRQEYINNPKRLLSDYIEEKRITVDYKGRQILELLQNAEDAGSTEVLFSLDTELKSLTISNNGKTPFSAAGINSLMLANFSSKSKRNYIGNKGLGFRSVLNWAEEIHILSHGCIIRFSGQIAAREYAHLITHPGVASKLEKESWRLGQDRAIATLAIPQIENSEFNDDQWVTTIKLFYKSDEESDIKNQLQSFALESLLFLKNIHTITIRESGTSITHIKAPTDNERSVLLDDEVWHIYEDDNPLPEEFSDSSSETVEHYNIQVAVRESLPADYKNLFNYFPTQFAISLPCVLHATFDLDGSRNNLSASRKNEYIVERVKELFGKIALSLTKGEPSWNAIRILTPAISSSDSPLIKSLYSRLETLRDSLAIYPCVNGQFCTKSQAIYYNDEFAHWVLRNQLGDLFQNIVLPFSNSGLKNSKHEFTRYDADAFSALITEASNRLSTKEGNSFKERIELIKMLRLEDFTGIYEGMHYSLLIDENCAIVNEHVQVFTILKGSLVAYNVPDFVNLSFIDIEFYEQLRLEFRNEITANRNDPKEDETRTLKRILNRVVNLGSNDIIDVVDNIHAATLAKLKSLQSEEEKVTCVKKTLHCYFQIYRSNPNRRGSLDFSPLIITRSGEIKSCNQLFLGREYNGGILTESLFDNIYTDQDFVAGLSELGISAEGLNPDEIENFFFWLNVNRFVKFNRVERNFKKHEVDAYITFVFSQIKNPDNPNPHKQYKVWEIARADQMLSKLSPEKLVIWILKDIRVKQQLELINEDEFNYSYGSTYSNVYQKPSYILFQLSASGYFENYLLDDSGFAPFGFKQFNYEDPLVISNELDRTEINYILKKLGAKPSFNDLDPDQVYKVLREIPEILENGQSSQTLYKTIFEYFTKCENKLRNYSIDFRDLKYFARKGGRGNNIELQSIDKVYYSDNAILPQAILNEYWFLNLPKRSGENQVQKYFGVKLIKDEANELKLIEANAHDFSSEFTKWFEQRKPFFLTYRLSSLNHTDSEQQEANAVKSLRIKLVTDCIFLFGNKEFSLSDNQFINISGTYYFRTSTDVSDVHLIQNDDNFCESIAEILSICFKVKELKDIFRTVFQSVESRLVHNIRADELESCKDKAFKYFGVSASELQFWNAIFGLEIESNSVALNTAQFVEEKIKTSFGILLPDYYKGVDFEKFQTANSYHFLKWICQQQLSDLVKLSITIPGFCGLRHWHRKELYRVVQELTPDFNKAIWSRLTKASRAEQEKFTTIKNEFGRSVEGIIQSLSIKYALEVDLEYRSLLIGKLNVAYDVKLDERNWSTVVMKTYYNDILSEYDQDPNDLPENIQSLLFFPGHDEVFREISRKGFDESSAVAPEVKQAEAAQIVLTTLNGKTAPKIYPKFNAARRPRLHSEKRRKAQAHAGKRAEKRVFDALISKYPEGTVQWLSGNSEQVEMTKSDNLGYDMRYRREKNGKFYRLEVKSVTDDSFIISSYEVIVGFDPDEEYHLALVHDDKIYIIEDFFTSQEWKVNFDQLTHARSVRPLDYEVFFELPTDSNFDQEVANAHITN